MNKVVIFVGVLTTYQGIDILLEAIPLVVREFPKVKFLIIGYPNEEAYRQKARSLGVGEWTHFTGKIAYEEVPRYLSHADVAISPKISTTEGNLKLLTYMAMGLPTVVFDNPVNREILGDLAVYASKPNATHLAKAILEILQDEERAKYLASQCRNKAVAEYSWLAIGQRVANIYDMSIKGGNP